MPKQQMKSGKPKRAAPAKRKPKPKPKNKLGIPAQPKVQTVPAAYTRPTQLGRPKFTQTPEGTIIRHQEYLMDVPGTTTFTLPSTQVVICQPGLTDSFPWLAQQAGGYELYKWRKLRFVYRNRIMTGSSGSVYMVWQADSEDAIFGSKQELLAYDGAREGAFYRDMTFSVDMKSSGYMRRYFVRTSTLSSGSDSQIYDYGMFSICCNSSSAVTIAGELLVEYEIEFFKPKINPSMGAGYYQANAVSGANLSTLLSSPLAAGYLLRSEIIPYNNYFQLTDGVSNDSVTLPLQGCYLFYGQWNITGTVTAPLVGVVTMGANIALTTGVDYNPMDMVTGAGVYSNNPASMYVGYFTVSKSGSGADNQLTFSYTGGTGTTSWTGNWGIVVVNPNALGPAEAVSRSHPRVRARQSGPRKEGKELKEGKRPVRNKQLSEPSHDDPEPDDEDAEHGYAVLQGAPRAQPAAVSPIVVAGSRSSSKSGK